MAAPPSPASTGLLCCKGFDILMKFAEEYVETPYSVERLEALNGYEA